jgi:hypothetical protein
VGVRVRTLKRVNECKSNGDAKGGTRSVRSSRLLKCEKGDACQYCAINEGANDLVAARIVHREDNACLSARLRFFHEVMFGNVKETLRVYRVPTCDEALDMAMRTDAVRQSARRIADAAVALASAGV